MKATITGMKSDELIKLLAWWEGLNNKGNVQMLIEDEQKKFADGGVIPGYPPGYPRTQPTITWTTNSTGIPTAPTAHLTNASITQMKAEQGKQEKKDKPEKYWHYQAGPERAGVAHLLHTGQLTWCGIMAIKSEIVSTPYFGVCRNCLKNKAKAA